MRVILHAKPYPKAVVVDNVKIAGVCGHGPLAFYEQVDVAQVYRIDADDAEFFDQWEKSRTENRHSDLVSIGESPRESGLAVVVTTENGLGGSTRYVNLDMVVICDAYYQPLTLYLGNKERVWSEAVKPEQLKMIAALADQPLQNFTVKKIG